MKLFLFNEQRDIHEFLPIIRIDNKIQYDYKNGFIFKYENINELIEYVKFKKDNDEKFITFDNQYVGIDNYELNDYFIKNFKDKQIKNYVEYYNNYFFNKTINTIVSDEKGIKLIDDKNKIIFIKSLYLKIKTKEDLTLLSKLPKNSYWTISLFRTKSFLNKLFKRKESLIGIKVRIFLYSKSEEKLTRQCNRLLRNNYNVVYNNYSAVGEFFESLLSNENSYDELKGDYFTFNELKELFN